VEQPIQVDNNTSREPGLIHHHRGMVWIGRNLKDLLVPIICHGQGHRPLDQVTPSPIQPCPEHIQGGGSHSFSGQDHLLQNTSENDSMNFDGVYLNTERQKYSGTE